MPFLINLSNTNLIIDFSTNLYQYLTCFLSISESSVSVIT